MVASFSLFLLSLSASSYHCRHRSTDDGRRHATPLFGVKSSSSSRSSGLRREEEKKSLLSAHSARIEGQKIDGGGNILTSDIHELHWKEKHLLLKRFQEREGHCNVPQSHKEDGATLGTWVSTQRQFKKKGKLDPERQMILEEIGFEWATLATWEERFDLMKQFKKREGHCNVSTSHKEDGVTLGLWVNTQRQFKKNGKLDPERRKILEEIGFEWGLTSATWEERFALLKQFIKREGHCNVPQAHEEDGATLGVWINTQRQFKKKGKLDQERQKILEEIGFEWAISARWEEIYVLLQQFKKREGHGKVPQSHKEDGASLGLWVNAQRQFKKKGKLDPERQNILEEIGFDWGLTSATWEDSFALLKQFIKREGHCNVPQSHKVDGINLGTWVKNQRQFKKKGKLDPERQKILEEIGFEWVLVKRGANVPWEEKVSLLKQFTKREGHCNIPQSHGEGGVKLGVWVNTQRKLKRNEKLDPDRQKILEDIGFEWVPSKIIQRQ